MCVGGKAAAASSRAPSFDGSPGSLAVCPTVPSSSTDNKPLQEEQRKARQLDLERLLQRYHNVKAELDAQQNVERQRARKGLGASSVSRASSARMSSSQVRPGSAAAR